MALPILDGNQTATTLATTVSGGAHYPNHIIASGTVTANVYSGQYIKVTFTGEFNGTYYLERKAEYLWQSGTGTSLDYNGMTIGWNDNVAQWEFNLEGEGLQATNGNPTYLPPKNGWVNFDGLDSLTISYENPLATQVFGTVTVGNSVTIGSCVTHGVTVANSVTIASLPAISGTVTIGNFPSTQTIQGTVTANTGLSQPLTDTQLRASAVPVSISSVTVSNFPASQTVTFSAITGSTSIIGTPSVTFGSISGSVTATLASTTVTVSALPSGALTTRFGSVTTANTAQITAAVTNTSRKYLLAQNISAGTVTIGIGFSPTTTQGIQLTAGGGLTFDTFCPTGAVYWLGATTGANFTILEG